MKKIEVEIKGLSPLLMNSPAGMVKEKSRQIIKEYNHEEDARKSAYWSKDNKELIIPSEVIRGCFMAASSGYRVGKKSARGILAGVIRIEPLEISLGTSKYEIDIRRCVIQKNAIMKARATLPNWKAKFIIVYDDRFLPTSHEKMLYQILEEAGSRYGIMDYRPQRGGPFGTFEITKWSEGK